MDAQARKSAGGRNAASVSNASMVLSERSIESIQAHLVDVHDMTNSKRVNVASPCARSPAENSLVPKPNTLIICEHHDVVEIDSARARHLRSKAMKLLARGNFFDTEAALGKVEPLAHEAKSIGWCINCFLRPADLNDLCAQCDHTHGQYQCRYCRLMYTETDFLQQYRLAGCVERANTCIECAHLTYLKGFPKFCEYCRREAAWTTSWTGGDSITQTNFRDIQFYCALCIEARKRAAAAPHTCAKCKFSCSFKHGRRERAFVCINCDIVGDTKQRGVAYHMRDPALNKYKDALLVGSRVPKAELQRQLLRAQDELQSKRAKKRDLEQRLRNQSADMPPAPANDTKRRKMDELHAKTASLEALLKASNKFAAHRARDVNCQATKQMMLGMATQVILSRNAEMTKLDCRALEMSAEMVTRVEEEEHERSKQNQNEEAIKAEVADLFDDE